MPSNPASYQHVYKSEMETRVRPAYNSCRLVSDREHSLLLPHKSCNHKMSQDQLKALKGKVNGGHIEDSLPKIKTIEYFRVKPRWLFVKITDDAGGYGWGEGTLEGHTKAVEGALDEMIDRLIGYVAE